VFNTADLAFRASPQAVKAQKIDVDLLPVGFQAVSTPPPEGHISLRPVDDEQLADWSSAREADTPHPLTQAIQQAIVDEERRG